MSNFYVQWLIGFKPRSLCFYPPFHRWMDISIVMRCRPSQ